MSKETYNFNIVLCKRAQAEKMLEKEGKNQCQYV